MVKSRVAMQVQNNVAAALRVRIAWLIAVATLGPACGQPHALPELLTSRPRPLLFAHRGGGGEAPESTLPTFLALAARDPEAVIEFDVHRARSGELVVIHDDTVDRTTNGTGRVEDLDLATLAALDAGFCFRNDSDDGTPSPEECRRDDAASFPFRGNGYSIPLLSDVIEQLAALPAAVISIEVKSFGVSRQVADALAAWPTDRLVVGSADDETARELKRLLPRATHYVPETAGTCQALAGWFASDNPSCPAYDILAIPVKSSGLGFDNRRVIQHAHDRGMAVVYWTINDDSEIAALIKLGADGIITDQPSRARAVVDGMRARGELPSQ